MLSQAVVEFPWDKIASAGAGGIALMMCYLFLKHLTEMRKEHNGTIMKVSKDFATTVDMAVNKHNETTQMILKDSRDRESQLHAMLLDKRNHP